VWVRERMKRGGRAEGRVFFTLAPRHAPPPPLSPPPPLPPLS
jgi:hypothetical protein